MPVFTMAVKTKVILIAIAVLFLAGFAVLLRYAKPLVPTSSVRVIYGEGEDFKADAVAYKRLFRRNVIFLHFPGARSAPKWWGIDFNNMMVYVMNPPRSLFSIHYVVQGKPLGVSIDTIGSAGDWSWQFTDTGASFSGNAFSCSVKKTP